MLSAWFSGGWSSSITAASTVHGSGCSAHVNRSVPFIHSDRCASSSGTSTGRGFDPMINLFWPVPATAWVPLVALLIGYGDQASIFLITLSAFFPIVLGTISGARQVPERLIEAARMLGTSGVGVLMRVVLPAAAPAIVNGMRVGLGLAWVILVLSETTGVPTGLGSTIFLARDVVQTDQIVVGMICIAVAGFLSDRLLTLLFRLVFRDRPLIK